MELQTQQLRDVYSDLLLEYAEKDDRIVVVESDLARAANTLRFGAAYPARFYNVGIAEQSMTSIAGGLAAEGKVPFTHTFAAFATRRACDQVALSVAYPKNKVVIVGSDPAICAEVNGGTHQSMEDVAIMRSLPSFVVVEPCDQVQLVGLFEEIKDCQDPVYLRLRRKAPKAIYPIGTEFKLGKAVTLKSGKDVTIIASGITVEQALIAEQKLAAEGISASVLDMHTIKPLDVDAILEQASLTGAIVTAENHTIIGGLGSAVAEYLSETRVTPVVKVGIKDRFGQVGSLDYLIKEYELDADTIVAACHKAIQLRDNTK